MGQAFDVIVVDAASLHISGERVCRELKARFPDATLILITASEKAAGAPSADLVLRDPVSARQLTGAVSRILRANRQDILRCGPFSLNRTTRVLLAPGARSQLSPKLAALIALFMSRPNETLLRADIMRMVWKTGYLGDTRTLNVHIRQARQALEPDPKQPVYLKTVRGRGYRLEIETERSPASSAGLMEN